MQITTGQFSDSFFPIMDGVGMTAHNYALILNDKHGRSVVIAPRVKGYKDRFGYNVFRFKSVVLPGMNPYRLGLPLIDVRFKQKIGKVRFDLVHAHCPFISGQVAARIAKKTGVPLVATFHTKYKDDFKKVLDHEILIDFMMKMTLDFYQKADLVLVPNSATGETLRDYGFGGVFEIMPNGTDMKIPEKAKYLKYRKKGLERIGAGANEFIMLFVGQHRWEKNVRLIIEAMKMLKEAGETFRMVFAGEGYAEPEMKKLVKEYDIREQVKFLGLIPDRKDLARLYSASDLLVFPSVYDNSPLVVQEAAAYGVPSVLVRESCSAEGILDGVNGFLVENAPGSLFEKLHELMRRQGVIRRAGEGARKTLHHPWEDIVDNVHDRYTRLIREHQTDSRRR